MTNKNVVVVGTVLGLTPIQKSLVRAGVGVLHDLCLVQTISEATHF